MIKEGLTNEITITVTEEMTAKYMKSGALAVFATPMMISYMEACAFDCAQRELENGMTTVGVAVNITHDAPTPIGRKVTFRCHLDNVDRRKLYFSVEAVSDNGTVIGKGKHERFIIDSEKFMNKMFAAYQD